MQTEGTLVNWDAIGAVGEIIGAVAVVATLFYLARQINDGSRQIKMSSIVDPVGLYHDAFLPIYNNRENMKIWVRGLESPDELDDVDREIFFLFMRRLLNPFDTAVALHGEGTLDGRQFERYRLFTKGILESAGGFAWLAATPGGMTEEALEALA